MEALIIFIFLVVIFIATKDGTTASRPTYKRRSHKEYKEPEIYYSSYPAAQQLQLSEFRLHKHRYLQTPSWRKASQACKALHNHRCQNCSSTTNLNAHHINYLCLGKENPATDLLCLCSQCHTKLHEIVGYPQTVDEYLSFQGPLSVLKD